jgi:hypothetical protein
MTSVKSRYTELTGDRDHYVRRARKHAKVTIPSLFPESGASSATDLYTPFQSIGARGVNTLGNKLLITLFPPNTSFVKLDIDDITLDELSRAEGQNKGLRGEVDKALSKVERKMLSLLETSPFRPTASEVTKQLLVAGNVGLDMSDITRPRYHRLDTYVVKRSPSGKMLEAIIEEKTTLGALDPSLRSLLPAETILSTAAPMPSQAKGPGGELLKPICIFTRIWLDGSLYRRCQYVEDVEIPGTEASYPVGKLPYFFLRWTKIDNEDYGRAMCEDIYGDLLTVETLMEAITLGTAAMAKLVFLVNPAATTRGEDIAKANTGDFIEGSAQDVTVLQAEKSHDFNMARQLVMEIERRLSAAFLMNSAVQRSGERVTAEEIRFMAQDLESALGGVYSVLSQEWQYPLAVLLLGNKDMPNLPKEVITPRIITGVEALGRVQELAKLDQLVAGIRELFGPEEIAKRINPGEYIKRRAAALGITPEGLITTDEELAVNEQNAQLTNMAPDMIKAGTVLATKAMEPTNG